MLQVYPNKSPELDLETSRTICATHRDSNSQLMLLFGAIRRDKDPSYYCRVIQCAPLLSSHFDLETPAQTEEAAALFC